MWWHGNLQAPAGEKCKDCREVKDKDGKAVATASNKRESNERIDGGGAGEKRRKQEDGREDTSSTVDQAASQQDPHKTLKL